MPVSPRDCVCGGVGKLKTQWGVTVPCPACQKPKAKRSGSPYRHVKHGPCQEIPGSPQTRSSWERNFFRIFMRAVTLPGSPWYGKQIEYERHKFTVKNGAGKPTEYLPDFVIHDLEWDGSYELSEIVEVKGRLDKRGQSVLRGFAKAFPHLLKNLTLITEARNFAWIMKALPGARIIDYAQLKRDWSGFVAWE